MNIRILKVATDEMVKAAIRNGTPVELPSIHSGWQFNFGSRLRELANATAYILVAEETPNEIEGCLIFQMIDRVVPYMAYIEIAPHNRAYPKKYDHVAGCLIAFACKQSSFQGKGNNKGWLTFDVLEADPKSEMRLMMLYSRKYHAQSVAETTLFIGPDDGQMLIDKYLLG